MSQLIYLSKASLVPHPSSFSLLVYCILSYVSGLRSETTVDRMRNQLDTIFTHLEIKWNRSQEFENDKSSDLCAKRRNESYDETGLPQAMPNVSADGQETIWKQMTKIQYTSKENGEGCGTRLAFER